MENKNVGIIKSVGFCEFCDSFSDTYKNNFTYDGKKALFDYLEDYANDTGENVELDTVALCCEYSEYENATECIEQCQYNHGLEFDKNDTAEDKEKAFLEYLQDNTQVIVFNTGIIICDF